MGKDQLKHKEAIYSVFELMFESWMDEADKKEFIEQLLLCSGITLEKMDADIEAGLKNGYSVDIQLSLLKQAVESKK